MRANDPVVTFLLVLVIGIVAGILFDRLAGPSWLARQFSRSAPGRHHQCTRGRRWRVRRLSHRHACVRRRAVDVSRCRGGRCCRGAVRLANGQVIEVSPDQRVSRPSVAELSNYSRRWCLLLACIEFS